MEDNKKIADTPSGDLPACPVETTLTLISDKWKVLILRDLIPGTKRFGELKKSIGSVSQKVLTSQLRQMEASGLLSRKVYAEVPPRVEYTLTELGYSLKPILDACGTGEKNTRKLRALTNKHNHPYKILSRYHSSLSVADKEILAAVLQLLLYCSWSLEFSDHIVVLRFTDDGVKMLPNYFGCHC